jgi:hypothetical protein
MKAAIIGSSNLGKNGLAEKNIKQIAETLDQLGYDVTIFTPAYPMGDNIKFNGSNCTINTNVFNFDLFAKKSLLKLSNGISVGLIGLFSFDLIYKKFVDYDLYYFANPDVMFSRMTRYFYLHNKKPVIILGNHGTYFEYLSRRRIEKPLIKLFNMIIFKNLNRIDIRIQVQNDFQYNFYKKLGVPENMIFNMPQYNLDNQIYHTGENPGFTVVCNDNTLSYRWHSILKKMVKSFKFVNFWVIESRNRKNRFSKSISKNSNVNVFAHCDEKSRCELLTESDIMINLSNYEPLNSAYFEAPLSGLPLLSTNFYSSSTMSEDLDSNIILVKKPNITKLTAFIDYYRKMKESNPEYYAEMKTYINSKSLGFIEKNNSEMGLTRIFNALPVSDKKISIVTASLNEAGNIKEWLDQVHRTIELNKIKNIDEIIIVDDGSTDGTQELVEQYRESNHKINISLVKRTKKMGTLDAQIAGANRATNPYVLIMDCDLQHPVEYIKDFVDKFNQGYSIIIGSRYIVGSKIQWDSKREVISRIATIIAHSMFPFTRKIKDPLSGYFLCERKMLTDLKSYKYFYKALLYILIFNSKNKKIREIPVEMRNRRFGESKVVSNYSKTVIMYSREILIYYRDSNKNKFPFNKF